MALLGMILTCLFKLFPQLAFTDPVNDLILWGIPF
jgi:hypothetical protein